MATEKPAAAPRISKPRTTKAKPVITRWLDGSTPLDDLPPNEQMAHLLVADRRDLSPSVERIMSAELTERERTVALTAFQTSLGRIGDPNRDPRVAIANASQGDRP